MISFRKGHPAVTRDLPQAMCGFPQLSCHAGKALDGSLTADTKAFGVLYAGYDGKRGQDDLRLSCAESLVGGDCSSACSAAGRVRLEGGA